MPLQITGRHVEITKDQRAYIEKKLARLRRHFERIDEMSVTLSADRPNHIVEISFRAGSIHAFTKTNDPKPFAAIDKAIDRLETQVTKAKNRKWGNKKHVRRPVSEDTEEV